MVANRNAPETISAYLNFFLEQQPGWIEEQLLKSEWGSGVIASSAPNVQFARHCVRLLGSLAKARARGRMSPEQIAHYYAVISRFRELWPLPGAPRARPELLADLEERGKGSA